MPRTLPTNDPRRTIPDRIVIDNAGKSQLVEIRQIVIAVPVDALPSLTVSYAAHELHPNGDPMKNHHAMESRTITAAEVPLRVRQGLTQFIDWCGKEMADEMIPVVVQLPKAEE